MRIPILFVFLIFSATSIHAQQCRLNLTGTWKEDGSSERLFKFEPHNTINVFSGRQLITNTRYELDDSQPQRITFSPVKDASILGNVKTPVTIKTYDDTSITFASTAGTVRWTRVDSNHYFITLVARSGEFYDSSGSAFPILTRISPTGITTDAVGTYSDRGQAVFGRVPSAIYKDYERDPNSNSEVMLRLEINAAQYERALKVLQTWDRRAKEDALLYQYQTALNNIILIKAITETLNACREDIKLYKLNYIHPEDWISDSYGPQFIPFFYFKELKKLNSARHVQDEQFRRVYNQSTALVEK